MTDWMSNALAFVYVIKISFLSTARSAKDNIDAISGESVSLNRLFHSCTGYADFERVEEFVLVLYRPANRSSNVMHAWATSLY